MDAFTVTGQLRGRSRKIRSLPLLLNKLVPENFTQAQYLQNNDKFVTLM
jgi:hypothetical protein